MESDVMPIEHRLAVIVTLLSSSALHGVTACRAGALRAHLEAVALTDEALNPHLRHALEDALAEWISVECHQSSISVDFCALTIAGQALH